MKIDQFFTYKRNNKIDPELDKNASPKYLSIIFIWLRRHHTQMESTNIGKPKPKINKSRADARSLTRTEPGHWKGREDIEGGSVLQANEHSSY